MIAHKLKRKTNPPALQSAVAHQIAPKQLWSFREITDRWTIFFFVSNFQIRWVFVSALSLWQLWPHLLRPSLYGCQARVSGLVRQPMIKAIYNFYSCSHLLQRLHPRSLQIGQNWSRQPPNLSPFFSMLLRSSFVCMLRATKTKNYPSSYSILSLWLWLDFPCFYTLASQYASNKFTLTGTINFSCVLYI